MAQSVDPFVRRKRRVEESETHVPLEVLPTRCLRGGSGFPARMLLLGTGAAAVALAIAVNPPPAPPAPAGPTPAVARNRATRASSFGPATSTLVPRGISAVRPLSSSGPPPGGNSVRPSNATRPPSSTTATPAPAAGGLGSTAAPSAL